MGAKQRPFYRYQPQKNLQGQGMLKAIATTYPDCMDGSAGSRAPKLLGKTKSTLKENNVEL